MKNFMEWLNEWVKKINNFNKSVGEEEKAILDSRLFSFDKQTNEYSVKNEAAKLIKNSKYCFIGDNPGKLEKINNTYFYVELNKDKRDNRRAGSKVSKLIDELKVTENLCIFFNKCLISTPKTSNLKVKDIKLTMPYVVEFLERIQTENDNLLFVFFGVSDKFKVLYKNLSKAIGEKTILYHHFCGSKYKVKKIKDKIGKKEIFKVKFNNENYFHFTVDVGDNGNTDEDDGLSPVITI